jgi:hypothetical protein
MLAWINLSVAEFGEARRVLHIRPAGRVGSIELLGAEGMLWQMSV